jgi:NADH:ubiquinone oxidoreductase subunit 3 (subunit A)
MGADKEISNNEEKSNSITLDLVTLQKNYSNLLIRYQTAVADYMNFLNNQEDQTYVNLQGYSYLGTGSAGQTSATTLQDCQSACHANSACTGATFVSNTCLLRTGDSSIIPSDKNHYAIVPKVKQMLMNIENLNQQLINVNKQIADKIYEGQPVYYSIDSEVGKQSKELIQNYENLIEERDNIKNLLKEYETLDNTESENQIKINENYYSFILFFILAGVIIFFITKLSSGVSNTPTQSVKYVGELGINAYIILFILIIIIIIINFLLKYFYL